jgi:hypothetical protein
MARMGLFFIFGVLTPLSAVFELYQWRPVLVVEEAGVPRENHRNKVAVHILNVTYINLTKCCNYA